MLKEFLYVVEIQDKFHEIKIERLTAVSFKATTKSGFEKRFLFMDRIPLDNIFEFGIIETEATKELRNNIVASYVLDAYSQFLGIETLDIKGFPRKSAFMETIQNDYYR